jgi:uncharacterized YigZ family protein
MKGYTMDKVVYIEGEGEIVEKKSRFIGNCYPISSEEEAISYIEAIKKKHYDARHHCSAYILRGQEGAPDITRYSDDGEPQGTAGRPMLEVLTREELKDVMIVVTRYFGGTLLGTGGLVRAYTDACKEAVSACEKVRMVLMQQFSVVFDYTHTGVLDRYILDKGITRINALYTDKTEYILAIPEGSYDPAVSDIVDMTASSAVITGLDLCYSPVVVP